jgi:hypothetical protein
MKKFGEYLNEDNNYSKTPKSNKQLIKVKQALIKYKNMRAGEGNMISNDLWADLMMALSFIH